MIDDVPLQCIPLTISDRFAYFRERHIAHLEVGFEPADAKELAFGDLLATLGRKADRAFRIQFASDSARNNSGRPEDAPIAALAGGLR